MWAQDSTWRFMPVMRSEIFGYQMPPAPAAATLACHPNPFNPATTLSFTLPHPTRARLDVFDLTGRRVASLLDDDLAAGSHCVTWRPANTASGIYFVRLTSAGTTSAVRLALVC